jgi:hypothetical protein
MSAGRAGTTDQAVVKKTNANVEILSIARKVYREFVWHGAPSIKSFFASYSEAAG